MFLIIILGIGIMALGIYASKHTKKVQSMGMAQARVQDCQPSYIQILDKHIPCFEVTFEIQSSYGVVYKSIKDNQPYKVGDFVDVFYNPQEDKLELPKNVSKADSKGPYVVIGFGALLVVIGICTVFASYSESFGTGFATFLSYLMAVIFAVVGAFISIIRPAKRKKAMANCQKVQGEIIDFRKKRSKNRHWLYTPIYGFYYNGENMTIESNVSSNSSKSRQIGRKVTIIINNVTGEKYCLEDMNASRKIGIIFLLVGVALCALFICKDFMGMFDSSEEEYSVFDNEDSKIELNVGSKGYSIEPLNMPEDEYYSEYTYMPISSAPIDAKSKKYGYTIKIYHYGIGVVYIFPLNTTGKGINQSFSFYVDYAELKTVIEDAKVYDFESFLIGDEVLKDTYGEDSSTEYVYYYDGTERKGCGGLAVSSTLFDKIAKHVYNCVPEKVWKAIEEEIERYYE